MNTNKIREWLERVATMDEDPSFGRMSSDVRLKLAMAGVRAALAEIDKAVTDEELYRQAMEHVTPDALERMDKAIRAIDANYDMIRACLTAKLNTKNQ